MKTILISLLMGAGAVSASASVQAPATAAAKSVNVVVERTENNVYINGEVPLGRVDGSNREVWVTPVIRNGNDSIELGTTVIAGRNRYYQALRHGLEKREGVALVRASKDLTSVHVGAQLPYSPWMHGAEMSVRYDVKGCCSDDLGQSATTLGRLDLEPKRFVPTFNWVPPTAEAVKVRELRGQAYIDFPVNQTAINPDYRGNRGELAKIRATIDSVKLDKDVTARSLEIHGYASPEGSYAGNARLAKGRTEALKGYVDGLYHFAPGFIATQSTPEDWAGLVKWLETNEIDNRDALLAIARDGSLDPDVRDARIRKQYPAEYAFLLANVYPALRHSDYRIEYTVRAFTDPAEILRIAATRPQHLSLAEFFAGAKALPEGSQEFNDLFETAARMYPESEVASLNAANAAMAQGALDNAERYLRGAGDGADAVYARANLAALRGDYEAARALFEQAARLKVAAAPAALQQLDELEQHPTVRGLE